MRFSINGLTQLYSLTSPKIHSQRDGDTGEQWCSSSPKAGEDDVPAPRPSGGRSPLPLGLFIQLVGWGTCALERAICFTPFTSRMLISSQIALTDTPGLMRDQISGQPVAVELKHKVNHYHPLLGTTAVSEGSEGPVDRKGEASAFKAEKAQEVETPTSEDGLRQRWKQRETLEVSRGADPGDQGWMWKKRQTTFLLFFRANSPSSPNSSPSPASSSLFLSTWHTICNPSTHSSQHRVYMCVTERGAGGEWAEELPLFWQGERYVGHIKYLFPKPPPPALKSESAPHSAPCWPVIIAAFSAMQTLLMEQVWVRWRSSSSIIS